MASIPSLDLTLGAIVVSSFFSFLTMGIILTTTWQYYLNFPKDPFIFKLLVAAVFLLSLVDTVADGYWCYEWSVTFYARPTILGVLPIAGIVELFCISTSLIVQCFFAWRVWKISQKRNPYLPGFICTMSLLQWSVLVWVGVEWSTHRSFADLGRVLPIAYSWLISSAVADLSITASMVYYLGIRLRGQAMRTKGAFKVIISRTIQANVLSLASQIGIFALFMSNVGLYFFLNDFTVVKVYAFSLIVSLITRKGAYATHNTSETSATPRPTGISLTHLSSADFRGGARSAPNISINVRQDVEVEAGPWEHSQSFTHHKVDPELALNQDKKTEAY